MEADADQPKKMQYLPVVLDLNRRPCVVIGGGRVAEQKCDTLLAVGADVAIVSPALTPPLATLVASGRVKHFQRGYRPGDLAGYVLAVVATDKPAVQEAVAREARERGVLVNVVDRPELCTFLMPAILVRDDILVAVSTSGSCPGFAAALRDRMRSWLGPEYAIALEIARVLRERWKSKRLTMDERRRRAELLMDENFLAAIRCGDWLAVHSHVAMIEGEEVPLPVGDHCP